MTVINDWRDGETAKGHAFRQRLTGLLAGDMEAVEYCMTLTFIAHVWDDLVDKDRERTSEEISQAFTVALVGITANRFYLRHLEDLRPLMDSAILQWKAANVLETSTDHDKHMAYVYRASFIQIIAYCTQLVGWGSLEQEKYLEALRLYEEPLKSFMAEMKNRGHNA